MGYRDRLQSVIFLSSPEKALTKLTKTIYGSFGSSFPDESKIIHSDIQPTATRWLFHFSDRESLAVLFVPAVNHAAALASYPDAVAAEPLDDIRDDSAVDHSKGDDRRTCEQCRNLLRLVCTIAKPERGALVVANRGYRPDYSLLLRCAGYVPLANDSDQRTGTERWPGLIQNGGD